MKVAAVKVGCRRKSEGNIGEETRDSIRTKPAPEMKAMIRAHQTVGINPPPSELMTAPTNARSTMTASIWPKGSKVLMSTERNLAQTPGLGRIPASPIGDIDKKNDFASPSSATQVST